MSEALIVFDRDMPTLTAEAATRLAEYERMMKGLKKKYDAMREALRDEMEKHGITQIETDEMLITRIQTNYRETFDTAAFKRDHPDDYDEYVKITPVKGSVRIKLR